MENICTLYSSYKIINFCIYMYMYIHIYGKVARGIRLIMKARKGLNSNALLRARTLLTLCYSFIFQYFSYCNHIWGYTQQKRIINVIVVMRYRDPTELVFTDFQFLDLNKILILWPNSRLDITAAKWLSSFQIMSNWFLIFVIRIPSHALAFMLYLRNS